MLNGAIRKIERSAIIGVVAGSFATAAIAQDKPQADPNTQTNAAATDSHAQEGVALPTINVDTENERANGPVSGYVATKSATGTKTDSDLLTTPQSISVVTRDQLQAQGVQNIAQSLQYTAGVTGGFNPVDTRWDATKVRGFTPALYLDGLLLPIGASLFAQPRVEVFGLERIEVLRGSAASALYGQNPPGGLINMVSLRPTETPTHTVELQTNSFGNVQGAFDLGGPADAQGQWLYRLTGVLHGGGTQTDHVNDQRQFIAPAFTWRPNTDTTLTFLSQYQHDRTGLGIQFLPAQGTLYPNPNGQIPRDQNVGEPGHDFFERTQYMAGYQFEHRYDDVWTFRQNLRYAVLDTNTVAVRGEGLQADLVTLNRGNYYFPEKATAFTVDNQAQARFTTGVLSHTALFGLDYRLATSSVRLGFASAPSINVFDPVYGQPLTAPTLLSSTAQDQSQFGTYAQDQINFGHWGLTLSGRHDWVDTTTRNRLTSASTDQDTQAFSGRAALNYLFDSGVAPYIAYSRSFQPALGTTASGAPLKPTSGDEYEAGVKYQPLGTKALLTAAVFDLTQQNVAVANVAVPGTSFQFGEARSRGVELEAKTSLTDNLDAVASYTYTDARTTGGTTASLGKRLIQVPLNQAAAWADYTIHDGNFNGLGFGGGIRYVGDTYGDALNTLHIPSYTLVDAAIHYDLSVLAPELKGTTLAVNAVNLFDKTYVASCQSVNYCFYGTGRTVIASLRYSW